MLFLTQNDHRHDLGSVLARGANDAWTHIKLWGFDPCFIVTYGPTAARTSESWMLAKLEDVQAITLTPDESGETPQVVVQLMSPWWLNKQDQWQMDELDKVFVGENPLIPVAIFRYQLKDGRILERDETPLEPKYDARKTIWKLVFDGVSQECPSDDPK